MENGATKSKTPRGRDNGAPRGKLAEARSALRSHQLAVETPDAATTAGTARLRPDRPFAFGYMLGSGN